MILGPVRQCGDKGPQVNAAVSVVLVVRVATKGEADARPVGGAETRAPPGNKLRLRREVGIWRFGCLQAFAKKMGQAHHGTLNINGAAFVGGHGFQ